MPRKIHLLYLLWLEVSQQYVESGLVLIPVRSYPFLGHPCRSAAHGFPLFLGQ